MPDTSCPHLSYSAAGLFWLVIAILIAPVGALVVEAVAAITGGNQPARVLVAVDPLSDAESATARSIKVCPLWPSFDGCTESLSKKLLQKGGAGQEIKDLIQSALD